jgi:hypothetical protein
MSYTKQVMNIDDIVKSLNQYFDNHTNNKVKSKTLSRYVKLTHKQTRYVLRVHFAHYKLSSPYNKTNTRSYYIKRKLISFLGIPLFEECSHTL